MYAFIDRPVADLCNGGRFILWAMRAWTHAVERGSCPPRALAAGFAHMRLLRMVPDFHMAMALLNRDALAKIAFAPMPHPRIAEDEAVLLALWCDATHGGERNRDTLALLIDETSIEPARLAIAAGAARLLAAGFPPLGLARDTVKEVK